MMNKYGVTQIVPADQNNSLPAIEVEHWALANNS